MSYLGQPLRPSTYVVACNECGKRVKGEEAPASWLIVKPAMHYCPKCKRARQRKEAPR